MTIQLFLQLLILLNYRSTVGQLRCLLLPPTIRLQSRVALERLLCWVNSFLLDMTVPRDEIDFDLPVASAILSSLYLGLLRAFDIPQPTGLWRVRQGSQ